MSPSNINYCRKCTSHSFLPTKYLVYRSIGGQCAVKDGELPFQSLWDVITASSRMNHCCQELNIHNICELSWLLQIEETILFHQLSDNLISHLQYDSKQEV